MRPRCLLRPLCLGLLLIPLLSRLPETACVLQEYLDCRATYLFPCGGEAFNVSYPFMAAGRDEYCGFGERYKLSCRDGGIPVIEIGGRSYRVKRIDYEAGVLGVADLAPSQNRTCPLAPYEAPTLDWSLFEYTGDDYNLTLYGNCTTPFSDLIPNLYEVPCLALPERRSYVINPEEPPTDLLGIDILRSCESTAVVVPLGGTAARSLNLSDTGSIGKAMDEGFNLTWTPGYNSWCRGCISSGGVCGYFSSNETHVCFCSDNASAESCHPAAKGVSYYNFVETTVDGSDDMFVFRERQNKSDTIYGNLDFHFFDGISKTRRIVLAVVAGVAGFLLVGILCLLVYKRKKMSSRTELSFHTTSSSKDLCFNFSNGVSAGNDVSDVPLLDFKSVKTATSNFSGENKLGEGGFGPVYKGKLLGGGEIAVKRLSKLSKQGHQEFSNEVRLIAKLQHKNLVRLLGYCAHKDEKLLIYEYMPNKSLDKFIFDHRRSAELSWPKRFEIIQGISHGLLYLHHYSRMRVIHRDLKTSNILLDGEMNPKISDFGLARIFGTDQMEANTGKVVGTFGYMSPEYASQGLFSEKSDVFSFGVILLEIITGERSTNFYPHKNSQTLLGYIWQMWEEGRAMELLDPSTDSSSTHTGEVLKCTQLGLLCVQHDAVERPTMPYVVSSLSSETCILPNPGQPAFTIGRDPNPIRYDGASRASVNGVTMSSVGGR